MNSRKHWLGILLVLALGLLIYYGLRSRKAAEHISQPGPSVGKQSPQSNAAGQKASGNMPVASASNALPSARPQTVPPQMTQEQKLELAPSYMNVPINFYGRVVDQDGNPLPGVRVVVSVRQWYHAPSTGLNSTFPKTELTTDADGRFQFSNGSGDDLRIESLQKDDYEVEPKSLRGFGYNTSEHFNPDPNDPVVFRMWKEGTKQRLVTGDQFLPIVPDGRVYTMDLLKSTLTEGEGEGDLQISVKRAPNAAWGKEYDWSFDLVAVNGGIKEEPNAYESMFLAPQEGYLKNYAMEFHPGEEGWTYGVNKRFYLKAHNGQIYGRLNVEIDAYYLKDKQGRFGIKYAVNPSGSYVLQ